MTTLITIYKGHKCLQPRDLRKQALECEPSLRTWELESIRNGYIKVNLHVRESKCGELSMKRMTWAQILTLIVAPVILVLRYWHDAIG